jgi:hypothetical protein
MARYYPSFAILFVLGGLSLALAFFVLVTLASVSLDLPDDIVLPSRSGVPLMICLEIYFVIGAAASLLPLLKLRRVFAGAAHVSLIWALGYLCFIGFTLLNVFNISIFLVALFYARLWVAMTFPLQLAIQPGPSADA